MNTKKKPISAAQAKAVRKYEDKNYFRVSTRFKKQDEERIRKAAGKSLNGFITNAVLEAVKKIEFGITEYDPNNDTLEAIEEVNTMIKSGTGEHFDGSTSDFYAKLGE